MANKVNHRYIEGLVPLEGNGNKFIGIKNNTLISQTKDDLLYNLNISPFISFCLNSCEDKFIAPYGFVAENKSISLSPITLKDSTGNIDLNLTKKITKSIEGLFEEGNNKGCKDNSYIKYQQPIMSSETSDLGTCKQIEGNEISPAWKAMNGVISAAPEEPEYIGNWTQPIFTSNTATQNGITYTLVASHGSDTAVNAFNGDTTTPDLCWWSNHGVTSESNLCWIDLRSSEKLKLTSVTIVNENNTPENFKDGFVQVSNDGVNWSSVAVLVGQNVASQSMTFNINVTSGWLIYRLVFTSSYSQGGVSIQEITYRGTVNNGKFNDVDSWLSNTTSSKWNFDSTVPFIAESLVLVNTSVNNRTRNINISAGSNNLVSNYFCNADSMAHNYINIDKDKRIESNNLSISTLSSFVGNTVGFNEVLINGKTRYIQQNSTYNVFLISNEDQSKMDILLSSLDTPILPEGYIYYAFIQKVKTTSNEKTFIPSLGNDIYFETSNFPAKITNCKNQTAELTNINYIHFENNNSSEIIKYNVYIKLDGSAYVRQQEYHKCMYDFPLNPETGEVVSIIKNANIEAYEFDGTNWIEFDDVPVGEIYRLNNRTVSINQFPCNNNFYIKSIDNNIWVKEELYVPNRNYIYEHHLNIENIKEYKCDCILVCIRNDYDYTVGDCAIITSPITPFLSTTNIGLKINTISSTYKTTGIPINLSQNSWKLVFRIWR